MAYEGLGPENGLWELTAILVDGLKAVGTSAVQCRGE